MKPILFITALFLSSCGIQNPSSQTVADESQYHIQVYDVPEGYISSIEYLLNEQFRSVSPKDGPRVGLAREMPGNKLSVIAPPSVHAGVTRLLNGLDPIPPVQNTNYRIRTWILTDSTDPSLITTPLPPNLSTLENELEKEGYKNLSLLDSFSKVCMVNNSSTTIGRYFFTRIALKKQGSQLVTDINIGTERENHFRASFETQLQVTPDQLLVFGSSDLLTKESPSRLIYVYQVSRL